MKITPVADAIPRIESFILEPPGLDVALRVSIAQPLHSVMGAKPDSYAVIYSTDADYHFGSVIDAARMGAYCSEVAPAVIVGVGYADETGDMSFVTPRRFTDFYSGERRTMDAGGYGSFVFGGADAFLAALRDHVIPFVEGHIATIDPARRVLLGTSAGGHFGAYAMMKEPGLFSGYALMSPALIDPSNMTDPLLVRMAEDLPQGTIAAGTRVFLSAGSEEEDPGTMFAGLSIISNAYRMRTALAAHGVATEFVQFADEGHTSVGGAAISRALRFVLPAKADYDWEATLAATTDGDDQ